MPKKFIGVLTSGGDCPGLNAAIRAVGKAANSLDMDVIGFLDGFHGLVENRTMPLGMDKLSGILTLGGTILGTSRDKPHRMPAGSMGTIDMTPLAIDNYNRLHLDCLVCMGGGGTQKNAYRLMNQGLHIITLPKTIDNDVAGTDITFGFDTALSIATEAIDRLHTTADSHHRVIVVEIMGHNAGWLALGAGVAGGADVILIPEIPYNIQRIAEAILERSRRGKHFSIVAVSEGAMSEKDRKREQEIITQKQGARDRKEKEKAKRDLNEFHKHQSDRTMRLSRELERLTGLESRVTILGYVQRGGTPSARDRLMGSMIGGSAAALIAEGKSGMMISVKGQTTRPVKLETVVNKRRTVPADHLWVKTARRVGTCLGD